MLQGKGREFFAFGQSVGQIQRAFLYAARVSPFLQFGVWAIEPNQQPLAGVARPQLIQRTVHDFFLSPDTPTGNARRSLSSTPSAHYFASNVSP